MNRGITNPPTITITCSCALSQELFYGNLSIESDDEVVDGLFQGIDKLVFYTKLQDQNK